MQNTLTTRLLLLSFLGWANLAYSQVVLNEIGYNGYIELKNLGASPVNVSGYYLCNATQCSQVNNFPVFCPFPPGPLDPGEIWLMESNWITADSGELALFSSSNVADPLALVDYVQWGASGHPGEALAITAGIWTAGAFTPPIPTDGSLEYDGAGDGSMDWDLGFAPSFCEENGTGCEVIAGTIETIDSTTVCVNDSIDNYLSVGFSSNSSPSWYFVLYDSDGIIEDFVGEYFNLEGKAPGTSYIRMLGYQGQLFGLETGADLDSVLGCFDLSDNFIEITKFDCISSHSEEWEQTFSNILLSPNPVRHTLRLGNLPEGNHGPLTFRVRNPAGVPVFALPPVVSAGHEAMIETGALAPGIYFLEISQGDYSVMRRFVKF